MNLNRVSYLCCALLLGSGPGACELRPDVCAPVIDSVIGCDGMTYDNACIALAAGVRVAP